MTGAVSTDNRFLLQRYFLQILAGISHAEVVLDPDGELLAGAVQRVPFHLTAADSGVDVILLSPQVSLIDFRLQTPGGRIIEPGLARSEPGTRFVLSNGVSYCRLALPVQLLANRFDGTGTWHALLRIGKPGLERRGSEDGPASDILRGSAAVHARTRSRPANALHAQRASVLAAERGEVGSAAASATHEPRGLPCSVVVHAYSNLSLDAHLSQAGFEPGARIDVHASLSQSGIHLPAGAAVWAEVTPPDGSTARLPLHEHGDGQFTSSLASTLPGVYRWRVRARGASQRGEPSTREKTLTAAAWHGGDRPPAGGDGADGSGDSGDPSLCELLKCTLDHPGALSPDLVARLRGFGIDLHVIRQCLDQACRDAGP